jgi:hypothetical protein
LFLLLTHSKNIPALQERRLPKQAREESADSPGKEKQAFGSEIQS